MTNSIVLKTKTIKGRRDGPKILITGGVHGDEFEPMAAVRRLIHQLQAASFRGEVTLVPVVNEAAFERKHRWADDGLDLARVCPGYVYCTSLTQPAPGRSVPGFAAVLSARNKRLGKKQLKEEDENNLTNSTIPNHAMIS